MGIAVGLREIVGLLCRDRLGERSQDGIDHVGIHHLLALPA
jgi:hypothetical protein